MEDMVNNALRPHPGGEVLSEGFRLQITRSDMATLAGLNWLNDEVGLFVSWFAVYVLRIRSWSPTHVRLTPNPGHTDQS